VNFAASSAAKAHIFNQNFGIGMLLRGKAREFDLGTLGFDHGWLHFTPPWLTFLHNLEADFDEDGGQVNGKQQTNIFRNIFFLKNGESG
jgi:hypothetical protein